MRAELARPGAVAVAAYAGSAAGAAALAPALRSLRAALPEARIVLLWPADVSVPHLVLAASDAQIEYAAHGAAADPGAVASVFEAVVAALAAEQAAAVIVFTEDGDAPDLPAYLSYLAGVAARAAFAAEFSGGVLSAPLEPPGLPLPPEERHLYLLDRVLDL